MSLCDGNPVTYAAQNLYQSLPSHEQGSQSVSLPFVHHPTARSIYLHDAASDTTESCRHDAGDYRNQPVNLEFLSSMEFFRGESHRAYAGLGVDVVDLETFNQSQ
jgi:hypothetical protein